MSRTSTYTVTATAAPPGKVETSMEVTDPPPSSVSVGEEFTFIGYLQDVEGNRLAGMTINLIVNGQTQEPSSTTNSEGLWGWRITINEPVTINLLAEFPGTDRYTGCEVILMR